MDKMFVELKNYFMITGFLIILSISLWGNFFGVVDIEPVENRSLEDAPNIRSFPELLNFPQRYSSYFSDHFIVRNMILKADRWLRAIVLGQTYFDEVAVSQTDWLFYNQPILSDDCQLVAEISNEDLDMIIRSMAKASNYSASQGVELYYVIAPNKCTIYPEMSADIFPRIGTSSRADQIIMRLDTIANVKVLDLRPSLIANKSDDYFLYYSNDTHWNSLGIYLMHLDLVTSLVSDLDGGSFLKFSDFEVVPYERKGDLSVLLGIDHFSGVAEKWDLKVADYAVDDSQEGIIIIENQNPINNQDIVVFHDSFFNPDLIKSTIPYYFRRTIFLHVGRGYQWDSNPEALQTTIDRWQPDIIILEKTERNIHHFGLDSSNE